MTSVMDTENSSSISNMSTTTAAPAYEFTDYGQRIVVAVLILIVVIVGTTGNILVLWAVWLSKRLRLPVFVFVVNLSVADLLTSLVFLADVVALLGTDGLPVGEWFCSVAAMVKFTTIGCSICSLASIGLNRLVLIKRPATLYLKIFGRPVRMGVWLLVVWLFPFLALLIPPLLDVGALGFNAQYHFCASKSSNPLFETYNLIRVMALFPVPLVIIVISFVFICLALRNQDIKPQVSDSEEKKEQDGVALTKLEAEKDPEKLSSCNGGAGGASPTVPCPSSTQQIAISKTTLYLMVGFVVCFTPYAILIFLDINEIIPYTNVVLYSNSCINPIIYAITHPDFRSAFGCILRRRWEQISE